jgi:hypothetical protein
MCFTTRLGKTYLTSLKQHRFFHFAHIDHTHVLPSGTRSRHRWDHGKFVKQRQ